jgi:predicted HicB family RNase H-like nuclease
MHRKIYILSKRESQSLNSWIVNALGKESKAQQSDEGEPA